MYDFTDIGKYPVAVLCGGSVGRTCAADCKLAGNTVRLFDIQPFAEKSLKYLEKTGVTLVGTPKNKYGFSRLGNAKFDMVTDDMAKAVDGVKLILVCIPSVAHEAFFEQLAPLLKDGQIVHIIPDNYGSLRLRKKLRETGSRAKVIIGGWSSAPYGTRIVTEGGVPTPEQYLVYRAITLRGAALPDADSDDLLESTRYLGCFDSITQGDGHVKGKTVLDIGFSNVNPVIHVPGTVLGASVMENFGRIYGGHDRFQYSIYSHAFCPSLSEVQVAFYEEETALAEAIGVDLARYPREDFFSRASILGPEYMGEGCIIPFEEQWPTGFTTGPFTIQNRYITEDVPVGCHVYHELGKKFGIATPVIDSMITIASVMTGQDFYKTGVKLEDLGIGHLDKDQLLKYLNEGVYVS
ncbi:MAG: NAD/NADP octopine/nopaline dehydrogenase family protein [Clostridia bacterium]|nr:NAD/NADP octopine/nopaline dehydrogenase family protein [Clostridia bacterium]